MFLPWVTYKDLKNLNFLIVDDWNNYICLWVDDEDFILNCRRLKIWKPLLKMWKKITSTSSAGSPISMWKLHEPFWVKAGIRRDSYTFDRRLHSNERQRRKLTWQLAHITYQTGYQIWLFPWGEVRATPNYIAAWKHCDMIIGNSSTLP